MLPGDILATLKSSQNLAVLTGAGISAESGVPTFREAQTGLWSRYDPQQLATQQAFDDNPQLVWDWYTWRRGIISGSQPNPGHTALVDLEKFIPEFTLITQNVDGLHQSAGSHKVVELHGNIFRSKCVRENKPISDERQPKAAVPRCPDCGGYLRPDVVWFGESLPEDALEKAIHAASSCQAFLSIGTSTLVHPAASLPFLARRNGALILEINPQTTPLTALASYSIRGNAGDILPGLVFELLG
jgi:NAD-dependent deacetylase